MKNILIILFTLINISNSHHFGGQIEISNADENDWKNRETNLYSQSREMAKCTCDLTSHCNIGCCCDEKCSEEDRKEWKDNSLCLDDYKKWVEDYMCKDGEETFKYNKEKAGINIKDHIFNIMCIKYDRSCDMVNYYVNYNEEEDKPKIEALKEYWRNKFFGSSEVRRTEENTNTLKYGQNINKDLTLYKADSNGKCISTNSFFLIPFESSCYLDNDLDSINKDDINYQEYGVTVTDRKISDITYIISYNSSNVINKVEAKVLYISTNSNSKQIKFKVQWKKSEEGKLIKNFPPGYLQGNPIKVSVNNNIYNYGYYFHIYDYDGKCINDNGDSFNSISILFKNNMFISCTYKKDDDPTTTLIYEIYKNIINDNLKFYSAPNATENIKIINKTDDDFTNKIEGNNIKMHLIFLTTQKGKENSPYDIIQKVYLKMEYEKVDVQDTSPRKISLNVKFVDFSYSTIENSINNKITTSIPLPKKLLEKMSE